MVLKKYEPELSYILAELFDISLMESCSSVSSLVFVFKNAGERSMAEN